MAICLTLLILKLGNPSFSHTALKDSSQVMPSESTITLSAEKVLYFADWLYETEDYKSAIIEYKRALFLKTRDTSKVLLKLGKSNLCLRNYATAREYFSKVPGDTTNALTGISFLETYQLDSSESYFMKIKDDSLQNKLRFEYTDFLNLPYKNCTAAGILSAVVPGLGRVYAGRTGDGLFSFLFTMGSLAVSCRYHQTKDYALSAIAGTAGVLFYSADIYGSIEAVKTYNERIFKNRLQVLKSKLTDLY